MNFLTEPSRRDYYADLDIPSTATSVQIKAAYRKLILLHHPDKKATAPGETVDAEEFRRAQSAFDVLRDENKKLLYDMQHDTIQQEWAAYNAALADWANVSDAEKMRLGAAAWEEEERLEQERQQREYDEYMWEYQQYMFELRREEYERQQAQYQYQRREYAKRAAKEKEAAQAKWKQDQAARIKARRIYIAKEERMHSQSKAGKSGKPAGMGCQCGGCKQRSTRVMTERLEKQKNPQTYDEDMKAYAAEEERLAAEAAEQARAQQQREEEERLAQAKEADEEAARRADEDARRAREERESVASEKEQREQKEQRQRKAADRQAKRKAKKQKAAQAKAHAEEIVRQKVARDQADKDTASKLAAQQKAAQEEADWKLALKLAEEERAEAERQRIADEKASQEKAAREKAAEEAAEKKAAREKAAKEAAEKKAANDADTKHLLPSSSMRTPPLPPLSASNTSQSDDPSARIRLARAYILWKKEQYLYANRAQGVGAGVGPSKVTTVPNLFTRGGSARCLFCGWFAESHAFWLPEDGGGAAACSRCKRKLCRLARE